MRYLAILILGALVATTAFSQSPEDVRYASRIRSSLIDLKNHMRKNWELQVSLRAGETIVGKLTTIGDSDFELLVGKQSRKISYSNVRGYQTYFPKSKDTVLKRVGRGLQTTIGVAAIGTLWIASYPSTEFAGRAADKKAASLRKEIEHSLPQGSSKAEVMSFLDSQKIAHGDLEGVRSHYSYPNEANIKLVLATIPLHNRFSFYEYQIDIAFRFDGADRLMDSRVMVIAGGL